MASATPTSAEDQLRRARAELESDLRAARERRAEELLAAFPAVAADTEAALELVYTEFVVRDQLGQHPTPAEWYTRFPQWRADLEQMFQVHDELCRAEGSHPPAPPRKARAAPPAGRPPCPIDGYEILAEVGRGGMGVVFKARQTGLNRTVALKVMLSGVYAGDQERARFRREAEAAARLDHPHVVRVYEVGEQDGRLYCAMEFVGGGTLADRLTGTPWAAADAVALVATLARGADHAHERGVVHRDLKPANILLAAAGDPGPVPAPKIADFGLAKCFTESPAGPTRTGDVVGTPAYMAPEQAAGNSRLVGPPTDVWALGVILYELLTGHPPFQGASTVETLVQIRTEEPVPPRRARPQLPRDLETICLKCLAKPPARRYPSAAALADDLDRWARGEPILARPVGPAGRFARWCRRSPRVAALSAAVGGLLVAAGVLGLVAGVNLADARDQADKVAGHERAARERAEEDRRRAEDDRRRAEDDRKKEEDSRRREQRRVVRFQVTEGGRRLEDGDLTGAAVYFAAALENEPDPAAADTLRVRLGATLRACPTLVQSFAFPTSESLVRHLSADGSTLLTRTTAGLPVVADVLTGATRTLPGPQLPGFFWFVYLSDDGKVVAQILDGKAAAWDARTGRPVALPLPAGPTRLPHPFTPDGGRWLKAPAYPNGQAVQCFTPDGRPVGQPFVHPGAIKTHLFSPDGTQVATAGTDGTARVWDVESGRVVAQLVHGAAVTGFVFGPDGRFATTAGTDGMVQVWDRRTGHRVGRRILAGGSDPKVAFSPDGGWVVVAGGPLAQVCDAESGLPVGPPTAHGMPVDGVAFNPDGHSFALYGRDGTVSLRDARTGHPVVPPLFHGALARLTSDGRHLVGCAFGGAVRVWTAARQCPAATLREDDLGVAGGWFPDGRAVVVAGARAVVWRPGEPTPVTALGPPAGVRAAAVRPDGRRVATVGTDGVARLWDPQTGTPVGPEIRPADPVRVVAFAPDGRLATAGEGGVVRFWDGETGASVDPILNCGGPVVKLTFATAGRRVLVTGRTSQQLWDTAAGRQVVALYSPTRVGWLGALSPERGTVVFAQRARWGDSGDWKLGFYEAETGRETRPPVPLGGWPAHLAVSADGRRVATGLQQDQMIQVWDVETGVPVGLPIPHGGESLGAMHLSPDGRLLVLLARTGAARVWDTDAGQPVSPALDTGGENAFAAFSPDGRRLLTGGPGRAVRVHDLSPDPRPAADLADYARLLANRRLDDRGALVPLTRAEEADLWARFRPGR